MPVTNTRPPTAAPTPWRAVMAVFDTRSRCDQDRPTRSRSRSWPRSSPSAAARICEATHRKLPDGGSNSAPFGVAAAAMSLHGFRPWIVRCFCRSAEHFPPKNPRPKGYHRQVVAARLRRRRGGAQGGTDETDLLARRRSDACSPRRRSPKTPSPSASPPRRPARSMSIHSASSAATSSGATKSTPRAASRSAGKSYKVKFVSYDDQSVGGRVQQLYTRLINPGQSAISCSAPIRRAWWRRRPSSPSSTARS